MSNESNESSKVILEVGDTAPEFTLTDDKGQDVSLSDFRGRKVIVYFYPRANTPGCTKEACDFRDSLAELNEAGIDVLGISPDKVDKLAKFRDDQELTFPLLSDESKEVMTAYGAFGERRTTARSCRGSSGRRSSSTRRARLRWPSTT